MTERCIVHYAEWEMACCGTSFAIGSQVTWPVRPFQWKEGYLPPEVEKEAGPVDYIYDKHGESWESLLTLTGKVKKIRGLYLRFGPRPGEDYLYPVSGSVLGMENSPPLAERSKEGSLPRLDAYLVELEEWEIHPAREEDADRWE